MDVSNGNVERKGEHASAMVWDLGTGANQQPIVFVEHADRYVGLETGVLLILNVVLALDHQIGLSQSSLDIANFHVDVSRDVSAGVIDAIAFRLVMNNRRSRLHGIP